MGISIGFLKDKAILIAMGIFPRQCCTCPKNSGSANVT